MNAEAVGVATSGVIMAMDRVLGFYNRELDQIVPWKMYKDTIKEFDRYDFSNESAQLVGEIKTLMKDAQDNYFSSTQSIYEWCALTAKLLVMYLDLFAKTSSKTYEAQRMFLIKVLDDAKMKMTAGQVTLEQSFVKFNNMAGKLATLNGQLNEEFDSKSSYFKVKVDKMRKDGVAEDKLIPELQQKLAETINFFVGLKVSIDYVAIAIGGIKSKLRAEIDSIVDSKSAMATSETVAAENLDNLRYTVERSAYNLIAQCNEYQKRHGEMN